MKIRNKILISTVLIISFGLFYVFITENGYSPYDEGFRLTLYSDYKFQEFLNYTDDQDFIITKITDQDLKDMPELKKLIEKALSKKYPLNEVGHAPITIEELDNFQHQYAEILSEKYSRDSASFFTIDDNHMPEEYLAIDPLVHLRTFQPNFFKYENKLYGMGPNSFYIPSMEDDDFLRLEVYKINGLRQSEHTLEELSDKQIDIISIIQSAINDIGQHQENIEVQTGLSSTTIIKYENWQANTLGSSMFEYQGKIFSIGFWIA